MVKPELASGPTAGNRCIDLASTSTAAMVSGVNCGQDGSSFNCIHRGYPPVSVKMVERIRQWEFVELANLLIMN